MQVYESGYTAVPGLDRRTMSSGRRRRRSASRGRRRATSCRRSASGDDGLNRVGCAVLATLVLAGALAPAASRAADPLYLPHRAGEPSALTPDPNGTAATAVPGEDLSQDEADARVGWLVLTYVMDVRAALRRGHAEEAAAKLARVRVALRTLTARLDARPHRLTVPAGLDASLASGERALSARDRAGAELVLADSERALRAALAELDTELYPQSGAPR